jgi:hypothetical protein
MKSHILFSVFAISLFFSGCIETEVKFQFKKNGTYDSEVSFIADEIMTGKELTLYSWQLKYIFPEISNQYKLSEKRFTKNYSRYIQHTFTAKNKPIDDFKNSHDVAFSQLSDGRYLFEAQIPVLLDDVGQEEKDEVVLVLSIGLPKPIDIANSTDVSGNTVRWTLTKSAFAKGITLKATSK